MEYNEDEYLALSGVQHFAFCRRQWAIIHIEREWRDNLLTTMGEIMHERAHDDEARERRGSLLVVRGLRVHSRRLGISGQCDVVEFRSCGYGFRLAGEDGLWNAVPVEYKKGRPKDYDADRLQLCAQALCLEEMLGCEIPQGFLYYGASKRRESVELDEDLRQMVERICREMHELFARGHVPRTKYGKKCRSCSLVELCMPKETSSSKRGSVEEYVDSMMRD